MRPAVARVQVWTQRYAFPAALLLLLLHWLAHMRLFVVCKGSQQQTEVQADLEAVCEAAARWNGALRGVGGAIIPASTRPDINCCSH